MKKIELLAPAKNYEFGKEAVNHGADAVYIGCEFFGAREAASNSVKDIEKLALYAHKFNSKVYIAFNTILFDDELEKAEHKIKQLWNAGADALIIQDMGILKLDIPPIPLFASTQVDNRNPEKIKFLEKSGFERIILARELSLDQIGEISKNTNIDLEAFVHGSLCVSYSGKCYLSYYLGKRSANRGNCGQPCRLKWNLCDANGKIIEKNRHLLSLKDMDRSENLEDLIDAGISSFKIEGRLKDISYVKNITGLYRKKLDSIILKRKDLKPLSSGKTELLFTPDPLKTFSRGKTSYFLYGKRDKIESFDTPKSIGEKIGSVEKIEKNFFTIKTDSKISNNDGLCFFDKNMVLKGIKVNKFENGKIFLKPGTDFKKLLLSKGLPVYRNYDHEFLKFLKGESSKRKIGISLLFKEIPEGFVLYGEDEDKNRTSAFFETEKIKAKNKDYAFSIIENQLSKLGNSIFYLKELKVESDPYFISSGDLNGLRRKLVEKAENLRIESFKRIEKKIQPLHDFLYPQKNLDYSSNVSNKKSIDFYNEHGVEIIEHAFEIKKPEGRVFLMNSKHCIRYSLGICLKNSKNRVKGPLYLENEKGKIKLEFDCENCEMFLVSE
ncbi:MAG: U32 family peptidase [Desulforegulaceae bacterium]|nr:U32 family peptidase [Desulforegulaceae bacterium]